MKNLKEKTMVLTLIIETVLLVALLIVIICWNNKTKQTITKLQKEKQELCKINEYYVKELKKRAGVENLDLH